MSHIPTSPYHKEQHLEMLAHLKIHQKLSFYHIGRNSKHRKAQTMASRGNYKRILRKRSVRPSPKNESALDACQFHVIDHCQPYYSLPMLTNVIVIIVIVLPMLTNFIVICYYCFTNFNQYYCYYCFPMHCIVDQFYCYPVLP